MTWTRDEEHSRWQPAAKSFEGGLIHSVVFDTDLLESSDYQRILNFGAEAAEVGHTPFRLQIDDKSEEIPTARHLLLRALELGAVWAGSADAGPPVPLDGAILFAPAGSLVPPALRALRPGGTLACAGIYMSDLPSFGYSEHLFGEKVLTSVTANTRRDGRELLEIAAQIPIRARTRSFPLASANEALLRLKQDGIAGSGVLAVS